MSVTDPIADMLTRIRNASAIKAEEVVMPASRMKVGIAKILREEGFIKHYKVMRPADKAKRGERRGEKSAPPDAHSEMRVFLRYGPNEEKVINGMRRISKPGLRRYTKATDVPLIEGGLGITIVSTSHGLLTGKQCRKRNIGGELLCAVW